MKFSASLCCTAQNSSVRRQWLAYGSSGDAKFIELMDRAHDQAAKGDTVNLIITAQILAPDSGEEPGNEDRRNSYRA